MKSGWQTIGRLSFWLTWPAIWLVIRLSPPRTRGIVIADGRILLLKQWLGPGNWGLPGGGRRRNESAKQCIIREIKEETGLKIEYFQVKYFKHFNLRENGIAVDLDCFIVSAPGQTSLLLRRPEIVDAGWFTETDMRNVKLSPATQQILSALDQNKHLLE